MQPSASSGTGLNHSAAVSSSPRLATTATTLSNRVVSTFPVKHLPLPPQSSPSCCHYFPTVRPKAATSRSIRSSLFFSFSSQQPLSTKTHPSVVFSSCDLCFTVK
ncbi:hypothetical protein B296_00001013 [Ensete ventricosum]|uniref:Uncharacterized protein n=1 Tax=Ensete ventricosum TaxID=4639 RepID=A0A426Z6S0_ENSVE|nr:hypothetical protein B296_00001013 [Ensete ventricosum]